MLKRFVRNYFLDAMVVKLDFIGFIFEEENNSGPLIVSSPTRPPHYYDRQERASYWYKCRPPRRQYFCTSVWWPDSGRVSHVQFLLLLILPQIHNNCYKYVSNSDCFLGSATISSLSHSYIWSIITDTWAPNLWKGLRIPGLILGDLLLGAGGLEAALTYYTNAFGMLLIDAFQV